MDPGSVIEQEDIQNYENFIYDSSALLPLTEQEVDFLLNLVRDYNNHSNVLYGIVDLLSVSDSQRLSEAFLIPSNHPAWHSLLDFLFYEENRLPDGFSSFLPTSVPLINETAFMQSINFKNEPSTNDIFLLQWLLEFKYSSRYIPVLDSIIRNKNDPSNE